MNIQKERSPLNINVLVHYVLKLAIPGSRDSERKEILLAMKPSLCSEYIQSPLLSTQISV